MKLIPEEKVKAFAISESDKFTPVDEYTNGLMVGIDVGVTIGVSFAEKEYQKILLELIESIFDYEKESGSRICDFDRSPQTVYEQFVITKKSNE